MAIIGTLATLLLLFETAASMAGSLLTNLAVDVTQEAGGLYGYDYALSVLQGSTLGGSQLFLSVSTNAGLASVSAPSGWDVFYTPGDPDISFLSSAPSSDITPGGFGLFSLTSPVGPAANDFLVRGFDYDAGTSDDNPGTIETPSTVPEPSGFILSSLGASCAAAFGLARRSASGRRR
jgi:hypothetical protein